MNKKQARYGVTGDIKIQEALRQSEELHRIILTNISDSVFLTDDLGNFTFICPNVDNIFGFTFDEIYGMKNISALIGHDIYDPGRLEDVSEIRNVERVVWDKNGGSHIVLINIKKVNIRYGTRLFTCRDITEYKRVEEELTRTINHRKRVEKDLAIFFNLSADLFCITDRNRFRKLNPAWATALGYPANALKGKTASDFIHPDDVDVTLSLEKRMTAGSVIHYENRYRHRDGTYKWFSWSSIMSDTGMVHAVGRDITQKKKEEYEIKRRLIRFKLEPGRLYLVKELSASTLIEAFKDLLGLNYHGMIISRNGREKFDSAISESFEYCWLSERPGTNTIRPDPGNIEKLVESFPGEYAIVLDSLDYIIGKFGFQKTLTLIGHLREIAFFKNQTLLVNIDPSCVSRSEMSLLEKEALVLKPYPKADVSEDLLIVVKAAYEFNCIGKKPTRTDICRKLGISQPTLRKRMGELVSLGFLLEARDGRSVVVEVTETGRTVCLR